MFNTTMYSHSLPASRTQSRTHSRASSIASSTISKRRTRAQKLNLRIDVIKAINCDQRHVSAIPLPVIVTDPSPEPSRVGFDNAPVLLRPVEQLPVVQSYSGPADNGKAATLKVKQVGAKKDVVLVPGPDTHPTNPTVDANANAKEAHESREWIFVHQSIPTDAHDAVMWEEKEAQDLEREIQVAQAYAHSPSPYAPSPSRAPGRSQTYPQLTVPRPTKPSLRCLIPLTILPPGPSSAYCIEQDELRSRFSAWSDDGDAPGDSPYSVIDLNSAVSAQSSSSGASSSAAVVRFRVASSGAQEQEEQEGPRRYSTSDAYGGLAASSPIPGLSYLSPRRAVSQPLTHPRAHTPAAPSADAQGVRNPKRLKLTLSLPTATSAATSSQANNAPIGNKPTVQGPTLQPTHPNALPKYGPYHPRAFYYADAPHGAAQGGQPQQTLAVPQDVSEHDDRRMSWGCSEMAMEGIESTSSSSSSSPVEAADDDDRDQVDELESDDYEPSTDPSPRQMPATQQQLLHPNPLRLRTTSALSNHSTGSEDELDPLSPLTPLSDDVPSPSSPRTHARALGGGAGLQYKKRKSVDLDIGDEYDDEDEEDGEGDGARHGGRVRINSGGEEAERRMGMGRGRGGGAKWTMTPPRFQRALRNLPSRRMQVS